MTEAGGERGVSTVEMAIATVLVVGLLLAVVQIGVYFHARSVAVTAARHALDAARVQGGNAETGTAVGAEFLGDAGGSLLDHTVAVDVSAAEATATVDGTALSVLFGLDFPVRVTVSAPTERVVE